MIILMTYVTDWYNFLEMKTDQRVRDWLFMSTPIPSLAILIVYYLLVTKVGPALMKNRKPFNLRNIILAYNAIQIIISCYLLHEACFTAGWLTDIQWFCQLPDNSTNPRAYAMARGCWLLYMGKIFDLCDTIFFVLRKKPNQVTSLHLFHHMSMVLNMWIATKFLPGGSLSFFALINSFVHVVMYGYYFLAALGPHMQKYLWWKQYLTQMQLIQFVAIILHGAAHLFIADCAIPKIFPIIMVFLGMIILVMFLHFYRKEYMLRSKKLSNSKVDKKT